MIFLGESVTGLQNGHLGLDRAASDWCVVGQFESVLHPCLPRGQQFGGSHVFRPSDDGRNRNIGFILADCVDLSTAKRVVFVFINQLEVM
jgi:hypothetical protein